ncbi:MAG: ATP synthase F0 subunit B [Acidobacteriaceae bacterium]
MTLMRFSAMFRRLAIPTLGLFLFLSVGGVLRAQSNAETRSPSAASNPNPKQTTLSETDKYRLSAPVVKFGAALGMKPETASNVFTIFNILVLILGVGYGLLKLLPKAFRKRNTAIQKHLVDARTATEEATTRLNSVEERLSRLDEQIAAMRSQAEADSERDEERIKASVEDEKNKILAAAESEIQSATTAARREIQKYAAELAIEQAARKLVVSTETDRLLVENFAHKLGEGSNN